MLVSFHQGGHDFTIKELLSELAGKETLDAEKWHAGPFGIHSVYIEVP